MIARADLQYVNGVDVYAAGDGKIGSAGRVYLDDRTGEPEWLSVHIGGCGSTESFVPLDEATLRDDRLEIPFDKDRVEGAPQIPAGAGLDPADEDRLCAYYDPGAGNGRLDTDIPDRDSGRSGKPLVAGHRRTGWPPTGHLREYLVTEQPPTTDDREGERRPAQP